MADEITKRSSDEQTTKAINELASWLKKQYSTGDDDHLKRVMNALEDSLKQARMASEDNNALAISGKKPDTALSDKMASHPVLALIVGLIGFACLIISGLLAYNACKTAGDAFHLEPVILSCMFLGCSIYFGHRALSLYLSGE